MSSVDIQLALQNQAAIVLERLNGMKGRLSTASKRLRQRLLNHWSVMTFHRILEAKCAEYGVLLVSAPCRLSSGGKDGGCGAPSRQEIA
ncbi:MAG: IS200/IS605 family accessory protein TnpB-related protein [Armatimonadota bacterium]